MIDAGIVSYADVQRGEVSLVEIVRIADYLNMKADIEYAAYERNKPKGGGRFGNR